MPTSAEGHGAPPTRHVSVQALLKAHPGETDPKALIRRLAQQKIASAKAHGWAGPPFCPRIFASLFGIRCKGVLCDIGGEGRILPHPNGHAIIEYRQDRLLERQRFTIFHEFAHTLFPDFCSYQRAVHHAALRKLSDPEKEFENLCDIAAAEMLLPKEDFCRDLTELRPLGFMAVNHLRQRYIASVDATTHRLVELTDTDPIAAVFLTDQRGKHSGEGPLWVKYSCRNPLFKGFIQPGITPPQNSVVYSKFQEVMAFTAPIRETWSINGSPRSWLVQALKLPDIPENPDYPKVVALLFSAGYGGKLKTRE